MLFPHQSFWIPPILRAFAHSVEYGSGDEYGMLVVQAGKLGGVIGGTSNPDNIVVVPNTYPASEIGLVSIPMTCFI